MSSALRGGVLPRTLLLLVCVTGDSWGETPKSSRSRLLPFRPPTVQGVPLVTSAPSPLAREAHGPDRAAFNSAWRLLCRLTAHPDVLDRTLEGYEKFGISKAGTRVEVGYTALATELVRTFVPKSQLEKFGDLSQSEFERVRLFRALVEEYRGDFAAIRLKPPMRIGFASVAKLGEYDPVRQGFPIEAGAPNVPYDHKARMGRATNEKVSYVHRRSPREFDFFPLGRSEAERLLPTLRHREVLVMAAYRVTDIGPGDMASAIVTLEDEVYAVYHPALLTKPLAVIREPKESEPTPTATAEASGEAVDRKMAEISRQYELLEFNGIPVVGYQHSFFADKSLSQRAIVGTQTLVDLIGLHYDPYLLSREREENGYDPTPLLTRQLKPGELAPFLNAKLTVLNGRNRWIGASEFERRRNRDAFVEKYGPVLRQRSLAAPLRFAIYGNIKIGGYDFEREGFSFDVTLPIHDRGSILNPTTVGEFGTTGVTLPPSLRCPSFLPMSPDAAEAYVAKLGPPSDQTSNVRRFPVVLMADVPEAPNARPYSGAEKVDPKFSQRPALYVRPGRLVIYRDAALKSPLEELPIDVAAIPTLVDGGTAPAARSPFLSERSTWLGILLRDNHTPTPADYAAAARDQLHTDNNYYTYGWPSHPLDPSPWNPSKRDWLSLWYGADLPTTEIKGGYFDPHYKPFFPEGFVPHHDSPTPLNSQQLAILQKTLLAKAPKEGGPLMMRALVRGGEAPSDPRIVTPVAREITDHSDPAWESVGDDPQVGSLWEFIEAHRFT